MKITSTAVVLTLAFSVNSFAADKHKVGHDLKPMHGGVVVEVKDIDYELVAKADLLQLYLRDHSKPVDVSKASGKITLLSGAEKQEVVLNPAGNKLEAKGTFKISSGTKVLAQVVVGGKSSTARFAIK